MSASEKLLEIAQNEQRVYEAGKKAGDGVSWDIIQQAGARVDYDYGFAGLGWTADNFKPRYVPIKPVRAVAMFQKASNLDLDISTIVDFSDCTAISNTFNEAAITKIGTINAVQHANGSLNYAFLNARKLKTIEKIIVSESTIYTQAFDNCASLEDVAFEGTIGMDINFKWSTKLSKKSLLSIVNALSKTTLGKKVTFSKTAVNAAFGVDVDVESTLTEEYWNWRTDRPDWEFLYV